MTECKTGKTTSLCRQLARILTHLIPKYTAIRRYKNSTNSKERLQCVNRIDRQRTVIETAWTRRALSRSRCLVGPLTRLRRQLPGIVAMRVLHVMLT